MTHTHILSTLKNIYTSFIFFFLFYPPSSAVRPCIQNLNNDTGLRFPLHTIIRFLLLAKLKCVGLSRETDPGESTRLIGGRGGGRLGGEEKTK